MICGSSIEWCSGVTFPCRPPARNDVLASAPDVKRSAEIASETLQAAMHGIEEGSVKHGDDVDVGSGPTIVGSIEDDIDSWL